MNQKDFQEYMQSHHGYKIPPSYLPSLHTSAQPPVASPYTLHRVAAVEPPILHPFIRPAPHSTPSARYPYAIVPKSTGPLGLTPGLTSVCTALSGPSVTTSSCLVTDCGGVPTLQRSGALTSLGSQSTSPTQGEKRSLRYDSVDNSIPKSIRLSDELSTGRVDRLNISSGSHQEIGEATSSELHGNASTRPRLKVRVDILNTPLSQLQAQADQPTQPRDRGKRREAKREEKTPREAKKKKSKKSLDEEWVEEEEDEDAAPASMASNKSTIDCPVCKDKAIAHFHYGGMCCYSCKAFFRRVVNTSKANKYKCRTGKNNCDVSLGNRRSCQACRYRKCVGAGMKPGLVLSDDQCNRRFGTKKLPRGVTAEDADDLEAEADEPQPRMEQSQDCEVTREDLSVLIDGEKSYDEQNRIGRTLFISLFDTGSVRTDGLEERELNKFSAIDETAACVKSFQIEQQLNHSRKFLSFHSDKLGDKRRIIAENGKINTGDLGQTLFEQTIMLLKSSKDFHSIPISDQTELLESNLMTVTLLSIYEVYSATSHNIVWKLTEKDFDQLAKEGKKVPHGRITFGLAEIVSQVDPDMREDLTKLFNFFDHFSQIQLPRKSLYILLHVVFFNQDCTEVKNKDDIENCRKYYLFCLFETLVASEGVLGACSIAARLHTALNELNRIAQILGQKFMDVEET